MTKTFNVIEYTKCDIAVSRECAELLGRDIVKALQETDEIVELSFDGIISVASSFLYSMIDAVAQGGIVEECADARIRITADGPRPEGRALLLRREIYYAYDYHRRPEFYKQLEEDYGDM